MRRSMPQHPKASQAQKDELAEWEARASAWPLAGAAAAADFIAVFKDRAEYLQSLQKPLPESLFEARVAAFLGLAAQH